MLGGALPRGQRPRMLLQMLRYSAPPDGHYSRLLTSYPIWGTVQACWLMSWRPLPGSQSRGAAPKPVRGTTPEGPWDSCKQETAAPPSQTAPCCADTGL